MAKKKESTLTSWDDADKALRTLGEKTIQVENLEGQLTVEINKIKEVYEEVLSPMKAEIKDIEENITLYAEANKSEFLKDRTKKLNFGQISYRLTESLVVKSIKGTIAALKTLSLTEYLRIKEEPDKEALKGLDDSILVKIGVSRKKIDKLSIEPTFEKIVETAAQTA